MKLINILYRGGCGGEFLGSLLTQHKDVITKKVTHDASCERWFIERDDKPSHDFLDGSEITSDWVPDKILWNLHLEHGWGFHLDVDYYRDYLWRNWDTTKTIILAPNSLEHVKYTDDLAKIKVKPGPHNETGIWLKKFMNIEKLWNEPWKTCQEQTQGFKDIIPEGHNFTLIDPYDLFHNNEVETENCLNRLIDYLELDDYLFDEWCVNINYYRVKNKTIINKSIF